MPAATSTEENGSTTFDYRCWENGHWRTVDLSRAAARINDKRCLAARLSEAGLVGSSLKMRISHSLYTTESRNREIPTTVITALRYTPVIVYRNTELSAC